MNKKNRKSKHCLYPTWRQMIRRCSSEKSADWDNYGGRGIKVCDRWKNSFETFLEDMGERPEGCSLDRIDVNGNYTPDNCKWASKTTQRRNQRDNLINKLSSSDITTIIELYNEEISTQEIGKKLNLDPHYVCGVVLGVNFMKKRILPKTYRFKDVCLAPQKNICRSRLDVDISSEVIRGIRLDVPLIAANMSTVTNADFCKKLYELGALGVIHRAMPNKNILQEVKTISKSCDVVAASVGLNDFDLVKKLVLVGVNVLFLDVANGYSFLAIECVKKLRKKVGKEIKIVVGNTTNTKIMYEVEQYVDAVKLGIAQGDCCETFNMTGFTEGQLSTILKFKLLSKKLGLPVISDGSIKEPQDFIKAIAAGANSTMAGRIFAMCPESSGEVVNIEGRLHKVYAGMASRHVQNQWRGGVKPGTCSEGRIKYLPVGEPLENLIERYSGALRSGITYGGAKDITGFQDNAEFLHINTS